LNKAKGKGRDKLVKVKEISEGSAGFFALSRGDNRGGTASQIFVKDWVEELMSLIAISYPFIRTR
jgi:hypothetical protein